jgi:hypothetical protein
MLSVPAFSLLLFALAVPLRVPLDVAAAILAGGCLEVLSVSWATTLQQEIPPEKLSRVSSYDALGNYALTPVGTAIAGPFASRAVKRVPRSTVPNTSRDAALSVIVRWLT